MPPKTPEEIKQENIKKAHDKAMGKTLPETIAVDVSTLNTDDKVGGQMSSRQKINVQLEDGRVVKGFYTEDSFTDYDRQFKDAVQETIDKFTAVFPQNNELGLEFLNKIKDNFRPFEFLLAMSKGAGSENPDVINESLFKWDYSTKEFLETLEARSGENYVKYYDLFQDKKVTEVFKELGKKSTAIGYTYGGNIMKAKLSEDTRNVNRRNNALYEVSALLGHDELVCQSVTMTTTKDGQQKYGSFMVNAKGKDFNSIHQYKNNGRRIPMEYSGKGKRDISRLQVLDYICGNADRHSGNFFYDIGFVPPKDGRSPGKFVINGLQGIDNDMSFGRLTGEGNSVSGYMSNLDDIKVIDKDQKEAILNPDFAKGFENQMRLLNLSQEEINAGLGRLTALQNKLKTGVGIQVIDSEEKWNNLDTEPLVIDTDDGRANIWGLSKDVIQKAKEGSSADIREFLRPEAAAPIVTSQARNESSKLLFNSQLEDLRRLKEEFDKTHPEKASDEFKKMYDGLKDLINNIDKVKDKDSLTDREFNDLSMGFKEVMDNTKEYIRLKPKNPITQNGKDRLHCAKNMLAQATKGRHMVLEENTAAFNRRMTAEYERFNDDYRNLVNIDQTLADKENRPTQEYYVSTIKTINAMSKTNPGDLKLQIAAGYLQEKLMQGLGEDACKSMLSKEDLTACSETMARSIKANDTLNPKKKGPEVQVAENTGAEVSVFK